LFTKHLRRSQWPGGYKDCRATEEEEEEEEEEESFPGIEISHF
jgi:hypothetical protein